MTSSRTSFPTVEACQAGPRRRRGVATVEFALAAPLLVVCVLSFFELGHALMIDSVVENAAYEGARRGVVPGATAAAVKDAAGRVATACGVRSYEVKVSPGRLRSDSEEITVTVSASLADNSFLLGTVLGKARVRRSVTMLREPNLRFHLEPVTGPGDPAPVPRPRGRGKRR